MGRPLFSMNREERKRVAPNRNLAYSGHLYAELKWQNNNDDDDDGDRKRQEETKWNNRNTKAKKFVRIDGLWWTLDTWAICRDHFDEYALSGCQGRLWQIMSLNFIYRASDEHVIASIGIGSTNNDNGIEFKDNKSTLFLRLKQITLRYCVGFAENSRESNSNWNIWTKLLPDQNSKQNWPLRGVKNSAKLTVAFIVLWQWEEFLTFRVHANSSNLFHEQFL